MFLTPPSSMIGLASFVLVSAAGRGRVVSHSLLAELARDLEGGVPATVEPHPAGTVAKRPDADFVAFYRAERLRVVSVVASLTGDRGLAEDIVQEAFATALRRWPTIRGYDRPGDWVKRVALNRAISRFHRGRREEAAMRRIAGERDAPPRDHDEDDPVWAAVRALPRRQAQVMALLFIDDLTMDQTAETLGIGIGAVKTHAHRARRTLARALQPGERS